MFPWMQTDAENTSAQRLKAQADNGLKAQVEENRLKKQQEKQIRLEADRVDDARISRERAVFAAEAQAEIQAQRDREALVAQREAAALAHYQANGGEVSRAQQIKAFQQRREAQVDAQQPTFGARVHVQTEHTGITDRPSSRVHHAPGGASSFSLSDGSQEAAPVRPPPARAAAPPAAPAEVQGRPDLSNDAMAAKIRARSQGSSIFG